MTVKSNAVWAGTFVTVSGTGALTAATGTPTGTLYVDGTADGAGVTVTGSNPYKWSVTLPALTAGQRVDMYIAATISGVSTGAVVASDQADTALESDTYDRIGAPAGASVSADIAVIEGQTDDIGIAGAGLTALGDARLANLDAAVSTRSTYAGADTAGTTTLLSRLTAARAGYLDNLSAGAVATAAKLLSLIQSIARKDVTVDADIGGNYDDATDSLEALRDRGDAAWGASGVAATVWTYANRTLTQGAASITAAVTGSAIATYQNGYWSVSLTGLTDFTGWTRIYATLKKNPATDSDNSAIVQWRETATPAVGDGLTRINGAAAATATDGDLTVDSVTSITLTLKTAASALVPAGVYAYDVWYIGSDGQPRPASEGGAWIVTPSVTRATS